MTAISKNVYFDVLDDIVDKYNNTLHRTIKMEPIDITGDFYVKSNEIAFSGAALNKNPSMKLHSNEKILNLKLVTLLEFQNIKKCLLKDILQIGQKKILLLIK